MIRHSGCCIQHVSLRNTQICEIIRFITHFLTFSADTICGSLGGADRHKDKLKKVKSEDSSEVKEAGLAELGLWLGERLLGMRA